MNILIEFWILEKVILNQSVYQLGNTNITFKSFKVLKYLS